MMWGVEEFLIVNFNFKFNFYLVGEGGGWFFIVVLFCFRRKESYIYLVGVEIKWLMYIVLWELLLFWV